MARSTGKSPDVSQTRRHAKCGTLSRDKLSQASTLDEHETLYTPNAHERPRVPTHESACQSATIAHPVGDILFRLLVFLGVLRGFV
jgi:hypothetical protein